MSKERQQQLREQAEKKWADEAIAAAGRFLEFIRCASERAKEARHDGLAKDLQEDKPNPKPDSPRGKV